MEEIAMIPYYLKDLHDYMKEWKMDVKKRNSW